MSNIINEIFKDLFRLSTQIIGVRILYILASMIGMVFIAHLGTQELAAGALATSLSTTITVIGMSPLLAIATIVGRYHGAGHFENIGKVLRQAWILSVFLGVCATIIFWFLADILSFLEQPNELIPLVRCYFHGLAWGTIPFFGIACCHQLFFPIRRGNLVLFWGVINFTLVVAVGVLLTFGLWGLPKLGIGGWAYATSIVNWIIFVWILAYMYRSTHFSPYQLFYFQKVFSLQELKLLLSISFPITMQFSGELLAFSLLNIMVGWLGVIALSIQQIIIQCSTFALMFPMGAAQSISILIGQAIGAEQLHKVRTIYYVGLALVSTCMLVMASLYIFAPAAIIQIYIHPKILIENNSLSLAIFILSIAACSQFVDAIRNVTIGALRGLLDVWHPMWINFILLWGGAIPLAYWLAFPHKQRLMGLNLGFLLAFSLGAAAMTKRFLSKTTSISTQKRGIDEPLHTDVMKES